MSYFLAECQLLHAYFCISLLFLKFRKSRIQVRVVFPHHLTESVMPTLTDVICPVRLSEGCGILVPQGRGIPWRCSSSVSSGWSTCDVVLFEEIKNTMKLCRAGGTKRCEGATDVTHWYKCQNSLACASTF